MFGKKSLLMNSRSISCPANLLSLKNRYRSLEINIYNQTDYNLQWDQNQFFDSGGIVQYPTTEEIGRGDVITATVANTEVSILCGVTGSLRFKIVGTKYYLHIGFCNPAIGGYKNFIDISDDSPVQWGYDSCEDGDFKKRFRQGFHLKATFRKSVIAMQRFEYTISQV